MPGMKAKAPAKLNLFLEIRGKRPDGYHEIDTVMQELSLADELEVFDCKEVVIEVDGLPIPPGGENLVLKAARLLGEAAGCSKGARFRLTKRVPAGAGLGGGSSDAAAALLLLNRHWGLAWDLARLSEVAARIGSDVPFFLFGGTARCTGRGEKVEPLPRLPSRPLVLVWPGLALSTREVYGALRVPSQTMDAHNTLVSIEKGIYPSAFNRLEEAAFAVAPALEKAFAWLRSVPGLEAPRMSGSGSACFAFWETGEAGNLPPAPPGWKVIPTST